MNSHPFFPPDHENVVRFRVIAVKDTDVRWRLPSSQGWEMCSAVDAWS